MSSTDDSVRMIGPYRVLSLLGKGGMGEVYLAEDPRLGRKVALKLLSRELSRSDAARQRFLKESRAASALNNPNIVTIYDVGEHEGESYIAMEYVDGVSLRDALRKGRIEIRKALGWIAQAAAALGTAHDEGIVHRDIKPENLIVNRSGDVKLLDFGLAKVSPVETADSVGSSQTTMEHTHTEAGTLLGTIAYMSPEQAEGRHLDRRSDIFSLGSVLYELLTGQQPFEGKSMVERLHRIIAEDPPDPVSLNPKISPAVAAILARAMAKAPADRYQHAGDLAFDLRKASDVPDTTASEGNPWRPWRLLPWVIALAALIATILLVRVRLSNSASSEHAVRLTPITVHPSLDRDPTIAPDGETIAYASDRTGNFEIYLKKVTGGPDINLTQNVGDDIQPAFSPDGSQIAFVSSRGGSPEIAYLAMDTALRGGSIWIMSALGGIARRIADSGNYPSWSPDGTSILFVRGAWFTQRICIVPAVGGAVTELPLTLKNANLAYPSFSPDGRWIAFEADARVYVMGAKGDHPTMVTRGANPAWTIDGRSLLFTSVDEDSAGSLSSIPVSEGRPSGKPVRLTIGRGLDAEPAMSRDGKKIVFVGLDVTLNLRADSVDPVTGRRTGRGRTITSGNQICHFFTFSPDGKSIVFDSEHGVASHIWRVDPPADPIQLASDPKWSETTPAWAPDGSAIAFNRKPASGGDPQIWAIDPDGANPRMVVPRGNGSTWLAPKKLAYFSRDDGQIHARDLTTGTDAAITHESGVMPIKAVTADGEWVAFQSVATGNVDIRAVRASGGPSRLVVTTADQDFHPFFSRDGRWLYFQKNHKNIWRVPGPEQGWRSSAPEKVTEFPESGLFVEDPQLSPDGTELLYAAAEIRGDIWLMTVADK